MTNANKLFTVKAWAETHPWPPIGGLRHLIFFANANGFDKVIRRVGRRVLIDEAAFFEWTETQSTSNKEARNHGYSPLKMHLRI